MKCFQDYHIISYKSLPVDTFLVTAEFCNKKSGYLFVKADPKGLLAGIELARDSRRIAHFLAKATLRV